MHCNVTNQVIPGLFYEYWLVYFREYVPFYSKILQISNGICDGNAKKEVVEDRGKHHSCQIHY